MFWSQLCYCFNCFEFIAIVRSKIACKHTIERPMFRWWKLSTSARKAPISDRYVIMLYFQMFYYTFEADSLIADIKSLVGGE